jgi:hypothetical protein
MRENCSSGGNGGLGSGDRVILFSNKSNCHSQVVLMHRPLSTALR